MGLPLVTEMMDAIKEGQKTAGMSNRLYR